MRFHVLVAFIWYRPISQSFQPCRVIWLEGCVKLDPSKRWSDHILTTHKQKSSHFIPHKAHPASKYFISRIRRFVNNRPIYAEELSDDSELTTCNCRRNIHVRSVSKRHPHSSASAITKIDGRNWIGCVGGAGMRHCHETCSNNFILCQHAANILWLINWWRWWGEPPCEDHPEIVQMQFGAWSCVLCLGLGLELNITPSKLLDAIDWFIIIRC